MKVVNFNAACFSVDISLLRAGPFESSVCPIYSESFVSCVSPNQIKKDVLLLDYLMNMLDDDTRKGMWPYAGHDCDSVVVVKHV